MSNPINKSAEEEFTDSIQDFTKLTIVFLLQMFAIRILDFGYSIESETSNNSALYIFKYLFNDLMVFSKLVLVTFVSYLFLRFFIGFISNVLIITWFSILNLCYLLLVFLEITTGKLVGIDLFSYTVTGIFNQAGINFAAGIAISLLVSLFLILPHFFILPKKIPNSYFKCLILVLLIGYFLQENFVKFKKYPKTIEINKLNYFYEDYLNEKRKAKLPNYDFYYDKNE